MLDDGEVPRVPGKGRGAGPAERDLHRQMAPPLTDAGPSLSVVPTLAGTAVGALGLRADGVLLARVFAVIALIFVWRGNPRTGEGEGDRERGGWR